MKYVDNYNDYTFLPFFDANLNKDYTFEVELHIPKLRLRVLQMPTGNDEIEAKCAIYLVIENMNIFHH